MSKKAVMRILAAKEGWFCRYCRCKLLPIPEYELLQQKNINGETVPVLRRVRWNLETIQLPEGYFSPTIDHMIPKSQGGNSDLENLALACKTCNKEKADKPYDIFFASKEFIRRANKHRQKRR